MLRRRREHAGRVRRRSHARPPPLGLALAPEEPPRAPFLVEAASATGSAASAPTRQAARPRRGRSLAAAHRQDDPTIAGRARHAVMGQLEHGADRAAPAPDRGPIREGGLAIAADRSWAVAKRRSGLSPGDLARVARRGIMLACSEANDRGRSSRSSQQLRRPAAPARRHRPRASDRFWDCRMTW